MGNLLAHVADLEVSNFGIKIKNVKCLLPTRRANSIGVIDP